MVAMQPQMVSRGLGLLWRRAYVLAPALKIGGVPLPLRCRQLAIFEGEIELHDILRRGDRADSHVQKHEGGGKARGIAHIEGHRAVIPGSAGGQRPRPE